MNLQENIPIHIRRRIYLIDKVIDNLLPNMYPCDYNSSDHFVEGVLDEIFYLLREEPNLYGIDLISINDFILDHKYDELTDYFHEHCIVLKNDNLQESIRRILREELNNYDIVYRGQPEDEYDISPRNSIWVTYDYDFANLYGRVKEYKLPKNLNILDTDYYIEWESLVEEFDEYGDYEEYKYEPTDEFILFLESKGYDGFINGDNILIFNKNKLFK